MTRRKPAVSKISGPSLVRNTDIECDEKAPTVAELRQRALLCAQELIEVVCEPPGRPQT